MSKRRDQIIRRPPVVCPSCRGPLRATWNPTDRVIVRLDCMTCDYEFDFAAYRTAAIHSQLNQYAANGAGYPRQANIPGTD